MDVIDVLIVDDNPIVRAAMSAFLVADDRIRMVGEASNGHEGLAAARRLRPTVTLLDHRMPIADGLSVVSEMGLYTKVLALTSDYTEDVIASMLRGGVRGYLVHGQFDPPELLRAVLAVAEGRGWLSPVAASVATSLVRGQAERDQEQRERAERRHTVQTRFGITRREREVLNLLAQGLSNASIAIRLGLTEKTVKNHLNSVFGKLNVSSRTEAVLVWTGSA
ncbi:response regulator transcription factor [Herbidospora sp. NBRC 101105]|uniref:LuxR C-terminal-related transcriptional regulator n=1 Tax=Herbidospora sp. NBRC 101105 TaxID=3032195 RepID=UPI0024A31B09|nr:response regulator transcription factor [Herbidospora sp. NBRC 101105]GLX94779.1 DNA-binding response regulator [Herbidospora sp. NBRC 101105]